MYNNIICNEVNEIGNCNNSYVNDNIKDSRSDLIKYGNRKEKRYLKFIVSSEKYFAVLNVHFHGGGRRDDNDNKIIFHSYI